MNLRSANLPLLAGLYDGDVTSAEASSLVLSTVPVVLSGIWLLWYSKRRFDALERKFDAFEKRFNAEHHTNAYDRAA